MTKTPLQRVKDPTGRLDCLAANLIERVVEQKGDPLVSAIYARTRTQLEGVLCKNLGPRNRQLRDLRTFITENREALTGILQRTKLVGNGR